MEHAHPGMPVEIDGPYGEFVVDPEVTSKKHYIMFAAGSGITPIFSMIKTILNKESGSHISLVYAHHSYERIIFRDEIKALAEAFRNSLSAYHILSDTSTMPDTFGVFYNARLSKLIIKKLSKELLSRNALPASFYICGPFAFMEMITESLALMGINQTDIFREDFYIPDNKGKEELLNLPPRKVLIQWKEQEHFVTVATGQSILDAALKSELAVPHACKEAACGTCRSKLLAGEVKLAKNHILTEAELKQGQVLLSHGFPCTEGVVVKPMRQ